MTSAVAVTTVLMKLFVEGAPVLGPLPSPVLSCNRRDGMLAFPNSQLVRT
jgi:hypothetical protein